jgi:cell division protein FtsL
VTHDRRLSRDASRSQRPEREADPRVRRSVALALLGATLAVGGGLGLTALRVHQVQLAYRLDAVRAERLEVERLVQQLQLEIATLRSPGRVESSARQLGLAIPDPEQVRLAREYVAIGADAGRMAASDPAGGAAARTRQTGVEAVVR